MLAVTGATGTVGGLVARAVAAAGVPQRLVVRDPARAPELPGAEVAIASYDEPEALRRAFAGIRTLLFVSAAENEHRLDQHLRVVDAARDAGVERVVYTSFFGAAPDCTFTLGRDHWATEEAIRAGGTAWTMLRDNLYADFLPFMVGEDGAIRGPAGGGRLSAVAQADVAAVAARVILEEGAHDGATYGLTGPESMTLAQFAGVLTAGLGRQVRYVEETLDEAYASRASYGAPDWQVEAWVSTYTAIAAGEMDGVTSDVEQVTGQPATSLAQLLEARH